MTSYFVACTLRLLLFSDVVNSEVIIAIYKTSKHGRVPYWNTAVYILRLPDHQAAKVAISWTPADGRRKTGRPKKTWHRSFQQGLQIVDFKWEEVEYVATDRSKWRQAAARCAQRHGRRN